MTGSNETNDGEQTTDGEPLAVSSTYKVLGELDADSGVGVLGQNNADSGTPIGVQGAVPNNSDGYGFSTPNDAKIEGAIDTNETDFVVEAGTTNTDDATNVIMGHEKNSVSSLVDGGVICGGGNVNSDFDNSNSVSGDYGVVVGGTRNEAGGAYGFVGGGEVNSADGLHGAVPGGKGNSASGRFSFAAGARAKVENYNGAFVWGDSSNNRAKADSVDQVVFQAGGGMKVYTDSDLSQNVGAELPSGSGSWSQLSSRTAKAGVEPVDPKAVLEGVESLEVTTWQYDADDDEVSHMGPMAEEFHEAFDLGADEKRISTVDADGVAFAAIKGLSERLDDTREELAEKDQRIEELEADNEHKDDRIDDLEERLAALEAQVATTGAAGD